MSATKYSYNIVSDFPNNVVDVNRLTEEIEESSITVALDYIDVSSVCDVWFMNNISASEEVTLDDIINTHSGELLLDTELIQTVDGKLRVQATSRPLGTTVYFTSGGDDTSDPDSIGGGNQFIIKHATGDPTTQTKYLDFNCHDNPTHLHQGLAMFVDTAFDELTFELVTRATAVTSSESTTNYRVAGDIILPAVCGVGSYVTLDNDMSNFLNGLAFMPDSDLGEPPTAYWNADVDNANNIFTNITAAPLGNGRYNMFSIEKVLGRFINHVSLLGSGSIEFRVDDIDQIGDGLRLKVIGDTIGDDHAWGVSGMITLYRIKTA